MTAVDLEAIKVLFLAPDTLTLHGIPYDMRPGQQPGDLWRALRTEGWLWLGQPGWWGHLDRTEIALVKAWLAKHAEEVPQNPCEWSRVEG